jgi:hypothetical protein|tara:strand:+ start:32 stop:169 length:138 start_codon:yes stop_codon:yes gene_type:complete
MEYFGFYDDQKRYEAEQELNAYYDEQDNRFVESMQNEEPIEEVVE